jgi:hypothetical protein
MDVKILHTQEHSNDPLILTIDTNITLDNHIVNEISNGFSPSLGWNFGTNTSTTTEWRSSETYYDTKNRFLYLSKVFLDVVKHQTQTEFDLRQTESLQFARYHPGDFYKPHWDHFNLPNTSWIENDRIATIIFYLNDDFTGGTTYFPNLNLDIIPKKGRLLFFPYQTNINHELLLHEGRQILQGTKYIATLWIRQSAYR